ncbi:MAG: hypothetical protein GY801_21150 [bacterium]|nr:hypothetical protein [bacterium]
MRTFSSYGPIDTGSHYYAPRQELLAKAYTQLVGENPEKGGHYITVWAPRQAGKSWLMQQTLFRLREEEFFEVVKLELESLHTEPKVLNVLRAIASELLYALGKPGITISNSQDFERMFTPEICEKPLVLILDEFDALPQKAIASLVSIFRNIYMKRQAESVPSVEKSYRLHSVALIGVRSVLGIENVRGSPFNVQRSLHIPNLTFEEVRGMFEWYERESGQRVEEDVVSRLYHETTGQPGLTCWFGELLTEGFEDFRPDKEVPITMETFEEVYAAALDLLPNSNILNIISKAKQEPYKNFILELFKTREKMRFKYDDPQINFLYMNGVITHEKSHAAGMLVKFSSSFVQKRLFNYFSNELFRYMGKMYDAFEDLEDTVTDDALNIKALMTRYERHLRTNRDWLLKDAPRRADLRIYEAVFHFNLYMYLYHFLEGFGGRIYPEFPTGNGKIDLIVEYAGKTYGLEVKSYSTHKEYREALTQAAAYGRQLGLSDISLIVFVESIDEGNRRKHEVRYTDKETGVTVSPVFVEIGS